MIATGIYNTEEERFGYGGREPSRAVENKKALQNSGEQLPLEISRRL
jgi:hypothetical protein